MFSLAVIALSLGSLSGSPATSGRDAAPRLNGDMILASMDDFRGLVVNTRSGEATQVLELVYGLDESLSLFPAYLKVVTESGKVVERDTRHLARTIFTSLDQIHGCYLTINGRKTWVEGVQFGANGTGTLCVLGTRTRDEAGQLVDTFVALEKGKVVCASQGNWVCGSSSCSGNPPPACPDDNAPTCPCPSGHTGSCAPAQEWECRPGGWCPSGQTCTLNTSTNQCSCVGT